VLATVQPGISFCIIRIDFDFGSAKAYPDEKVMVTGLPATSTVNSRLVTMAF